MTSAVWGAGVRTLVSEDSPFQPNSLYYVLRSASIPERCKPSIGTENPSVTTVIDISGFGDRKLEAIRCYRSQRHLEPDTSELIETVRHGPEHYHRALPACSGQEIENHLLI